MSTRRLIATVIDKGKCKHYANGDQLHIDDGVSECKCKKGQKGLSLMANALLNAPVLPGHDHDTHLIRCPYHADGAVWEVQIESID